MNTDQMLMMVRIALAAGGTLAANKGIDVAQYNVVSGSIVTVIGALTVAIPVVWGWFVHKTDTSDMSTNKKN